jgi:hypothetical protein
MLDADRQTYVEVRGNNHPYVDSRNDAPNRTQGSYFVLLLFFRATAEAFFTAASMTNFFRLMAAFGKVQRFENQMA